MRVQSSGLWLIFSLGLLYVPLLCKTQGFTSFNDMLFLNSATTTGDVVVELAAGDFAWSQTLNVASTVTSLIIRGAPQRDTTGQPSTRFVCDDSALPATDALLTYQGLSITLENVAFTGCRNRGVPMVFVADFEARVSIVGSLFFNNSRIVVSAGNA